MSTRHRSLGAAAAPDVAKPAESRSRRPTERRAAAAQKDASFSGRRLPGARERIVERIVWM